MCKYCEKTPFFDKAWIWHDANCSNSNYSDGIFNMLLSKRICPICGKVLTDEPEIKTSIIQDFFFANLTQITQEELKKLIARNTPNYFKDFLEINGLIVKEDTLFCSCGEKLGKINKPIETKTDILIAIKMKCFCDNCNKKLQPLIEPL